MQADRAPKRAAKLIGRYLDPTRRWDRALDAELRRWLRDDEGAAELYRRSVVRHRLLVGGDPNVPSGVEQRRMMVAVLPVEGLAASTEGSRSLGRRAAVAGVFAAVAAIILVFAVPRGGQSDDDWLQARGLGAVEAPSPITGFGVSGVDAAGSEYEIIASGEAFVDDWIRVTYTNERPELGHFFLFGIQPERPADEALVWLAPLPKEGGSVAIGADRLRPLPFEIRLSARHSPGAWTLVGLFTTDPVDVDSVRRALDADQLAALPFEVSRLEQRLRTQLKLAPSDVVQVLRTRLSPGSASQEVPK